MYLADDALFSTTVAEITALTARRFCDNFIAGNLPALLECLSVDIDWQLPAAAGHNVLPFLNNRRGRDAVAEMWRLRAQTIAPSEVKVRSLTCEDNRAAAALSIRAICTPTGRGFDMEEVFLLTLSEDGKIASVFDCFDSSSLLEAFRANLSQQLIKVVRGNDVEEAKRLLLQGADANTRDSQTGLTVLMIAACQGNLDLVALLLDRGADPWTTDAKTGATALHKACQGGNADVVRLLVEHGAFVDAVIPATGHTPLMEAILYRCPEAAACLVNKNASLTSNTRYGSSLMQQFQAERDAPGRDKAKLLEIDGIFKRKQKVQETQIAAQQIMVATNKGDADAVQRYIRQGADVNAVYPIINSPLAGQTPLLVAARIGHTEICRELLRAGAQPQLEDALFRQTPLHRAASNGKAEILKLLLAQPDIDIDAQCPSNGYTPIHEAIRHGHAESAELLFEAGARLDLRGHDGKTPVDLALEVFGPDAQLVRRLRSKKP